MTVGPQGKLQPKQLSSESQHLFDSWYSLNVVLPGLNSKVVLDCIVMYGISDYVSTQCHASHVTDRVSLRWIHNAWRRLDYLKWISRDLGVSDPAALLPEIHEHQQEDACAALRGTTQDALKFCPLRPLKVFRSQSLGVPQSTVSSQMWLLCALRLSV